jgi:hypothetical protein
LWCTPVILIVWRLRQVDPEYQASLGHIVDPVFKKWN